MFTPEDQRSQLQDKWRREIQARIDRLRIANDAPQNSEQTTATLRGRICELKELLRLTETKAPAQDGNPE
jgi:hypothetical protein